METAAIQITNRKVYQRLSGSTLKIIAMVSMLLDHFGAVVVYRVIIAEKFNLENYDNWRLFYTLLRTVGRTAFPIFCFLLVEGFLHTRSRMKYAINMFLFALISEIPFDLAIYGKINHSSQNVYFTLWIGLLVIFGMHRIKEKGGDKSKVLIFVGNAITLFIGFAVAAALGTDYDYRGVLLIAIFYLFYHNRVVASIVGFLSFVWEYLCFPAFLLIQCYNGKRGLRCKYLFYLFYPVHLIVFYVLTLVLGLIST